MNAKFSLAWEVKSEKFSSIHHPTRGYDHYEWALVDNSTQENLLTFAQIYGFKNIQNLVNRFKKEKGKYNKIPMFIEVMACPGNGCLNGGGQVDPKNRLSILETKNRLNEIDALYRNIPKFELNDQKIILDDPFINEIDFYRTFYKIDIKSSLNVQWYIFSICNYIYNFCYQVVDIPSTRIQHLLYLDYFFLL